MAETSKVKQYFKNCFSKELLIQKAIIAGAALLIVFASSFSFYIWLKDKPEQTIVGTHNGFIYLYICRNSGIGWSALSGKYGAIYAIQSIMFVFLLAIFLLLTHTKITSSFVALAIFGGLFNLFQRATSGGNFVLDYFHFGFWESFPTFNWPDTFVVIGVFGFVISYIVLSIKEAMNEN